MSSSRGTQPIRASQPQCGTRKGIDISKCKETFEAERATGRFTHKEEDGERHTLILAVEGEQRNRIYMLQYTGQNPMQARDGKVTIVIRMKNK